MAKRGGFPGGGMPGNMANLMKQAQRMQRQMEEQQKELETKEFTATAGGGAVEVTVTGKREVTKVKLAEEVVDPDDIEMLEDLIVAATNEAPVSYQQDKCMHQGCKASLSQQVLQDLRSHKVPHRLTYGQYMEEAPSYQYPPEYLQQLLPGSHVQCHHQSSSESYPEYMAAHHSLLSRGQM